MASTNRSRHPPAERLSPHDERIDAIERLAGRLAHDFNNVLGIVSNSAHLIARQADAAKASGLLEDLAAGPLAEPLAGPLAAIDRAVQKGRELTLQLQGIAGPRRAPAGPAGHADCQHGIASRANSGAGPSPDTRTTIMTNTDINDTTDALNDLIETCKDGEYGFRTSSENVDSADLRQLFLRRAEECGQAARDLQTEVVKLGGSAQDSGSMAGAAHRGWVSVKGSLAGYTDLAVLEETERGEDVALESYRKALANGLHSEVRSLVESQYEGVKRNHAQIRRLRDEARNVAT